LNLIFVQSSTVRHFLVFYFIFLLAVTLPLSYSNYDTELEKKMLKSECSESGDWEKYFFLV